MVTYLHEHKWTMVYHGCTRYFCKNKTRETRQERGGYRTWRSWESVVPPVSIKDLILEPFLILNAAYHLVGRPEVVDSEAE